MFKDIVGILKTYVIFRIKCNDTEGETLRQIKRKEAWEKGGRRALRGVSSLSLNQRTVAFQQ